MTKYYLYIIFCLLLMSCGKSNNAPEPEPEEDNLTLEFAEKDLSHSAAEFSIDIFANCEWSFAVDADWAYIIEPKVKYDGPKALTIAVLRNETTSLRTATFSFKYSKGTKTLRVNQKGLEVFLTVSESDLSFGYRTAEKIISVASNCGWEAKADKTWVALKPVTGLVGSFDVTVNVETNNTKESRTATIQIWNETYGITRTINVSQNGQAVINDMDYIDEYGVNRGKGIIIRSLTWAPVNLGYHPTDYPFGKMFQWGRKYGLGYHDEIYSDSGSTPVLGVWNGANGEEDPVSFYKYGGNSKFNYDWLLNGDDIFWNKGTEENPVKNSQFDPCPDGWRVPTAFEFKSLIDYVEKKWIEKDGVKGYEYKKTETGSEQEIFFLPASGRLNASDGLSYDRCIEGYYWTNTANAGNSGYLFFYSENCSVNYQGSRAGACSVRCIKE